MDAEKDLREPIDGQQESDEVAQQHSKLENQDGTSTSNSFYDTNATHHSREEIASPSIPLEDTEPDLEKGDTQDGPMREETAGGKLDDRDLARTVSTVSIAETLSLPHEILFVSIICLAQFMTQVRALSPPLISPTNTTLSS